MDQLLPWIGGCSCSRFVLAISVMFCATGFPGPSDAWLLLLEWRCWLLQPDDKFELLLWAHLPKSTSLSGIGYFWTKYTSVTCFASSSHFPFLVIWILFRVPSLFRTWTECTWSVRTSFWFLLKKSEFRSSFPWKEFDENQFSEVKKCPSSPWPCRIHSSISRLSSFVFLPRCTWNTNWTFFSINSLCRFLVLFEKFSPSYGELHYWIVHLSLSHT